MIARVCAADVIESENISTAVSKFQPARIIPQLPFDAHVTRPDVNVHVSFEVRDLARIRLKQCQEGIGTIVTKVDLVGTCWTYLGQKWDIKVL